MTSADDQRIFRELRRVDHVPLHSDHAHIRYSEKLN